MKFCKKCQAETDRYINGKCKACMKASNAAWRAANSEKAKGSSAAWYAANTEKHKANRAAWYAANPEKIKASRAAWAKANPEIRRVNDQNRRARKIIKGGKLSQGLSAKLFILQKGKCPCCKQNLGDDFHLDHIVPLAIGGTNTDDNIQLLRQHCNNKKGKKHPVEFMQSLGFLI